MDFLYLFSNCFCIHFPGGFQQFFRFLLEFDQFIPFISFGCGTKFLTDFFIRNVSSLGSLVVGKVTQVDQQSQYIIFVCEADHIILKFIDIYFYRGTGQHFYDGCPQTIKIHVDQWQD